MVVEILFNKQFILILVYFRFRNNYCGKDPHHTGMMAIKTLLKQPTKWIKIEIAFFDCKYVGDWQSKTMFISVYDPCSSTGLTL